MLSSKMILRGLSSVILAGGIAACSSDGSNPAFTPGTYTGGVLIEGYESTDSVSAAETPFEEAPSLYGTIEIEVGEDNSISGTLEIDELLTGSDGPGDYDLTGTANADGTFSFTAGDYEFEGTLNDDGTLNGEVSGPDGQSGVVGAFLIEGGDIRLACGTLYWSMDEISPATISADYTGNAPGVVVFNGSEFAGIFGDNDTFGTFSGEAEDDGVDAWEIGDGAIDISLTINVPIPTLTPTVEEVVDLEGTTNPETPYLFPLVVDDNLIFNAGFVAESEDYEFTATFGGATSNCPGEISVE